MRWPITLMRTCAKMILAPVFSGDSPSQRATVIAEKTRASVARKIAIRLNCEGHLRQSSRLCDELQSVVTICSATVFRAAVRIEAEISSLLTDLQKLGVNPDQISARIRHGVE